MAGAFVGADARVVWGKAGVLEDDGADAGRRRLTAFAVRAGAMIWFAVIAVARGGGGCLSFFDLFGTVCVWCFKRYAI